MQRDWKAEGKKFAVIAGRFQPFHEGHADLVEYAIALGLEPIIMIADIPSSNRNPLTVEQRVKLIKTRFPQIPDAHFGTWQPTTKIGEEARGDVDGFIMSLQKISPTNECVMLHIAKGVDMRDQLLDGKVYAHTQYGVLLNRPHTELDGEVLDDAAFSRVLHASNIRRDFQRHRGDMYPANAIEYERMIAQSRTTER